MQRTRFSIASLMGFAVIVALGIAGLKAATPIWASSCFTLTLASLGAAVLLAIQTRGRQRAYWIGFSVAGLSYLSSIFLWPDSSQYDRPSLLTTVLIQKAEKLLPPHEPDPLLPPVPTSGSPFELDAPSTVNGSGTPATPPVPNTPNTSLLDPALAYYSLYLPRQQAQAVTYGTNFLQIGQSLMTLLVAYIGGQFSLFLAVRRERNEANPVSEISPSSP